MVGTGLALLAKAGSQQDVAQNQSRVELNQGRSPEEQYGRDLSFDNLQWLNNTLSNNGPTAGDVQNSTDSQRTLAALLDQYAKSGGVPGQQDLNTANDFANSAFAPQRTQLQQDFNQQNLEASRLAARLGRSPNDPILQTKLRSNFMNNSALLNAQQGSYATQYATQLPQQRLNYQQQATQAYGNLAMQAMSNRNALLGLGQQLENQNYQQRLSTATTYGTNASGGGFKGAVEGVVGGLGSIVGAGSKVASGFAKFGG